MGRLCPDIGKELEGSWYATLVAGSAEVHLVLTMANHPEGSATATIFNEADGLELPVTAITQVASGVTLELRAIAGSYSGVVNKDGTELAGTFSQHGKTAPLTFRRASQ